jgi:hypothetical protein
LFLGAGQQQQQQQQQRGGQQRGLPQVPAAAGATATVAIAAAAGGVGLTHRRIFLQELEEPSEGALRPPAVRDEAVYATGTGLRAQLSAVFDAIDKNHDGSVSRIELLLALRKDPGLADRLALPQHVRQEGGTRALFERVFDEIDIDSSDALTLDEFCAHFSRPAASTGVGGAPALPFSVAGSTATALGPAAAVAALTAGAPAPGVAASRPRKPKPAPPPRRPNGGMARRSSGGPRTAGIQANIAAKGT